MSSYLTVRHSRSTNTLSRHRPRPSMLTATPADSSRPVHAPAVNWTPWSVLNTSGWPRPSASSSMSWQNPPSSVFDSRQAITYRLNQSIVAARYMNPGRQVHEPGREGHVGDVRRPHLIDPLDRHLPEQV